MKKQIKIEITIAADDKNVGCRFMANCEPVQSFNEFTDEEQHRIINSLKGFAQLFTRSAK